MKRKSIFVLTIFVLISMFVFSSCGEESLNEIIQKTSSLSSIDATMDIKMNMTVSGVSMEIPTTVELKAKDLNTDYPIMLMNSSVSAAGTNVEIDLYSENGWMYITTMGESYKVKADDLGDEYNYIDDINNTMVLIPDELIDDVKPIKNDDGSKTYSFELPTDQFSELYKDLVNDINSSTGLNDVTVDFKNASVEIITKDSYISVYMIKFDMNLSYQNETIECSVVNSLKFNKYGEEVVIIPPEGYKDFEDMPLQ